MNIIIPIGGTGKRFVDDGYRVPKPLIRANGKQIIFYVIDSLNISQDDTILIPYRKEFDNHNFQSLLLRRYPKYNFIFTPFNYDTKGACETVLISLKNISIFELNQQTIIIDSDSFFDDDILCTARKLKENAIFYFKVFDSKPLFSYIKIEFDKIIDIAEKNKISNNACSGAYYFKSGIQLKDLIIEVLANDENKQKEEFYISCLYKLLIKKGDVIIPSIIKNFNCLGTPNQLKSYSSSLNNTNEKLRICFDLDNTLVSYPIIKDDYSSVEPIQKNINKLKYFKKLGHYIIIYTARRMKTHNGNVGAIIADIGKITINTLEKFDIPYDELFFGKPFADFYIDDLAINCFDDIEKEIGLYNIHPETRKHNYIKILKDTIIKKSENLSGEIYYYNNIICENKNFFPKLLSTNNKNEICIEKIKGITFSYFYINKILNNDMLFKLLKTINILHKSNSKEDFEIDIYKNYFQKMEDREPFFLNIFSLEQMSFYYKIKEELKFYQNSKNGIEGVIHGDLVFTNILLDSKDNIKFIDMRGALGETLTIRGDILYDFAKIYQSLIGYDYILLDKQIDDEYINEITKIFESYIIDNFGLNKMKYIKLITKSLLLTLMPIHNFNKYKEYITLINKIN